MASIDLDTGTDQLLASIDDEHVATITLNRPDKRNALSDELTPALRASLLQLEDDHRVRCIVITGAGTAFCAGGDVSGMGAGAAREDDAPPPTTEESITRLRHKQDTLTLRLHNLSKPTIAALPGPAAGAGLSIALACDLRIAADTAFVTTAFKNIGLSGDYGGSWLLTQLVGVSKAKELYYTARRVGAEEGLALGIFNEVSPFDDLATRTQALAREIAAGPPVALRYMKENLNRAATEGLDVCLAMEADRLVRSAQTADHRKAVRAFLDKTKPTFEGR